MKALIVAVALALLTFILLDRRRRALAETRKRAVTNAPSAHAAPSARDTGNQRDEVLQLTKDELYAEAKRLAIKGRSRMSKAELIRAIDDEHQIRTPPDTE
jgi:hypothetical protein